MSDGWGDALGYTVRNLYLYPELPRWRRSNIDVLTDWQAGVVLKWRKEAARLLGYTRHLDDQLVKLLDCAEAHLESVQGELAAWACRTTCPESGYAGLSQRARDLHAAVAALSRTAGPRVLLSDRLAADLIESMTGRQYAWGGRPAITSAKRELAEHGIAVIGQYGSSRTTEYCLLSSHTQGTTAQNHKCLVCAAPGVPDSRPELGGQDLLVFRVSVDLLRAKGDWRPGRAVAMARAELEERRQREAGQAHDPGPGSGELMELLEPPEPVIRYVRAADSAGARDDGSIAAAETHTDFDEMLGGDGAAGDPGTRRCDDDEEPGAGRR